MKKTLFFLFIFISANAQNKRTINLEIAGTLFSKINTEINNISDITLTGNILSSTYKCNFLGADNKQ